ncbi:MAG: transcription elongation factor GreA [bacterium]|nr:transcription elongation factor GreA [bacterium]
MTKYYLTKERLEELKEKLHKYKTVKRQEVAARLKAAKEYGDLSENSEYAAAKEEQAKVEAIISGIEEDLKRAEVIERRESVAGIVEVGSSVVLKRDKQTLVYTIVGPSETRPDEGRISNESPLGKSILGHKVGDDVVVRTPSGNITYKIAKIE